MQRVKIYLSVKKKEWTLIKKTAARYASWLCANGIVAPEKNKIYAYGMELVLSGLVNILFILLTSILFFNPLDGLLFLAAFIPLRTTAGGYHANSHLSCNLICIGTFIVLESLGYWIFEYVSVIIYLGMAIVSIVTLLVLSPSEAKNKPLTPERRLCNRQRSLILGGLNFVIGCFLIWGFQAPTPWCTSYYLGVIAASISMWATDVVSF